MDKMMYIEYGTKDTPADPILSRAVRKAEPKVLGEEDARSLIGTPNE